MLVLDSDHAWIVWPQVNIESLQCIAASLLVVCLDEETQNVSDQTRWQLFTIYLFKHLSSLDEKCPPLNWMSKLQICAQETKCQLLLLIYLDQPIRRSMKGMFNQMLTGGGGRFNGGNRWFDKTVQVGMIFQLRASDVVKSPSPLQHWLV